MALLEVIVALAIAAMTMTALIQSTLLGLGQTRIAAQTEEALSRAHSHLAVLGHGRAIDAGEDSGDDGRGFAYRLTLAPMATTQGVTLFAVRVTVSWAEGGRARTVSLDTKRLGTRP